jgi:hypothetical protein
MGIPQALSDTTVLTFFVNLLGELLQGAGPHCVQLLQMARGLLEVVQITHRHPDVRFKIANNFFC